jgi:hypothetical protein
VFRRRRNKIRKYNLVKLFGRFVRPSLAFLKGSLDRNAHPLNVEARATVNRRGTLAGVIVRVRRSSRPPRLPEAFDRAPLR